MISVPAINAILNGTSAVLIVAGYILVRQRRLDAHRICMTAALVTSSLFLISYLSYHYHHGSTRFTTPGLPRAVYLTILLTHTVLAAVVLPFILAAVYRAVRGDFARHMRVARWTFPIWLYVSVTGVIVYLMLFQLYPHLPPARADTAASAARAAAQSAR